MASGGSAARHRVVRPQAYQQIMPAHFAGWLKPATIGSQKGLG